jgi:uncharacterized alpha-E superfamily protein
LSSLLARFAENIFWIGRYLERAENMARVLHINETYSRDKPQGPDWERVLAIYGDAERFAEHYEMADAASVVNFYMLDRRNSTSLLESLRAARENARSVRHLISTEMWTHLNILYGKVKELKARDIRLPNLSRLATSLIVDCQTFEGITDGTFLRGEAWCFYEIGKYLERGDQITRVLDVGFTRLAHEEPGAVASVQWNVLLRSVSGYYAFRNRYPSGSEPDDIATFLLYDPEFPRSVALCVQRMTIRLRDLQARHVEAHSPDLEKARRALEFSLETGPGAGLDPQKLHSLLDQIQISLGSVSDAIRLGYFR